jgi:pullulanase/glycogen debranching enzyme
VRAPRTARRAPQVGAFPHYGGRWAEWNGSFRDTVRQFLKGTEGPWAGNFASALCGSPNLYANNHPAETDWCVCGLGVFVCVGGWWGGGCCGGG